jgi:quercetin dioxygenase-like cupin family protein
MPHSPTDSLAPADANIVDLFQNVIQLRAVGLAEPSTRASLADSAPDDVWMMAAYRFENDQAVHANVWERHPCGQEVICVLSGAVSVHLRDLGKGNDPVVTMRTGDSFIVPAGQWHRLSVVEPGYGVAITVGAGTQLEPVSSRQDGADD